VEGQGYHTRLPCETLQDVSAAAGDELPDGSVLHAGKSPHSCFRTTLSDISGIAVFELKNWLRGKASSRTWPYQGHADGQSRGRLPNRGPARPWRGRTDPDRHQIDRGHEHRPLGTAMLYYLDRCTIADQHLLTARHDRSSVQNLRQHRLEFTCARAKRPFRLGLDDKRFFRNVALAIVNCCGGINFRPVARVLEGTGREERLPQLRRAGSSCVKVAGGRRNWPRSRPRCSATPALEGWGVRS